MTSDDGAVTLLAEELRPRVRAAARSRSGGSVTVRAVEILSADPAQAAALRNLHVATWEATYRDRAAEPWYREGLAAHAVRDWGDVVRDQVARGGGVLIARCDGVLAGLCQYGSTGDRDHDARDVGHIHRLYVHPARQRTGIGRTLLAASTEHLRQLGARTATLWVLESDQRARAFYERFGWEVDGARKSGPPVDLRYRRSLR